MENNSAIVCDRVRKYYPGQLTLGDLARFRLKRSWKLVLDGIDFKVDKGEIFGIAGPNGAGKTTILKILANLTVPTSGKALIGGFHAEKNWKEVVARVGYCISEERSFYWRLTGRQNLEFFASLLEISPARRSHRIDELMEMLELSDAADSAFMNYSTGMKQKMAVARSLLAEPEVLLMDEPTRGLDPASARRLRSFIKDYVKERNACAIITTNRVSDIENLCERVIVLNRGRIIAEGDMESLKKDLHPPADKGELTFEEIFSLLLERDNANRKIIHDQAGTAKRD